ncbi:MAG: cupredoxin domain-containing protein [bacterium]
MTMDKKPFGLLVGLGVAVIVILIGIGGYLVNKRFNQQFENQTAGAVGEENGAQTVVIQVKAGYNPNKITVQRGKPVKLVFQTNNTYDCSRSLVIPALGVRKVLPENGTEVVEFTPDKTGSISFSCSMGMFGGIIEVL